MLYFGRNCALWKVHSYDARPVLDDCNKTITTVGIMSMAGLKGCQG